MEELICLRQNKKLWMNIVNEGLKDNCHYQHRYQTLQFKNPKNKKGLKDIFPPNTIRKNSYKLVRLFVN